MEIISNELDKLNITLDKEQAPIIKRVIHTSADFDYANNMYFSDSVIQKAMEQVGFVNVVQSKELIMQTDIPCTIAKARKGGSNIAAAICNELMYEIVKR